MTVPKISSSGKENFKNVGYISSLDAVYSTIIEREIKSDLSIINNIKMITDMIQELKDFTIKYVDENNK